MKEIWRKIKKSDFVIYGIAIMLVAAGYLNYSNINGKVTIETMSIEKNDEKSQNTSIGDAVLVNSDDMVSENFTNERNEDLVEEKFSNNEVSDDIIEPYSELKNYFTESKLNRDTSYASMISSYTTILNNDNVSDTQKKVAMQEITNINNTKNAVMICENLLSTKGFTNNVVFVNKKSVNVVVQVEGGLTTEKVAQIQNIIFRELETEISNIHITEK